MTTIRRREIAFELGLAALIIVVAAVALWQSWGRWLDPIIDAGRDLYVPEQLRAGSRLYRDILYFYPPLTPMLLALVTALTGSSLAAYNGIGIVVSFLVAAVIWRTLRGIASPAASACAALLFVACSMCGASSWGCNFIYPYAHATTFGMLFLLTTTMALLAKVRGGGVGFEALAVIAAIAACWTKIEHAVFATVLIVGASVLHRFWRMLGIFLIGLSITIAAALALLPGLCENVFPPALLGGASARLFYRQVMGLDRWREGAMLSVAGAAAVCAVAGLLAIATRAGTRWLQGLALLAAGALAWLLAGDPFFRAWTILQLLLIPFALRRPREPLAPLLFVSLAASSRVLLRLSPSWYGFVFMLPVYLLISYVLLEWMPARGVYSRRLSWLWAAVIVVIACRTLASDGQAWRQKRYPIITKRGSFLDANRDRAIAINELLDHLQRAGARTLVVMPEGLSLDYFAQVRDPLSFQTFTPVEIGGEATEKRICAEIEERRPEYVAIVRRDVREFGYRGFGEDYGRSIIATLGRNYVVDRSWALPRYQQLLLRLHR